MTEKPLRPGINLTPDETVEFFRAKGEYPVSRRWWEVWEEEHARAFTVAGVTDRTVLEEIRAQLDDVIANGGTFEMWKAKVLPELLAAVDAGSAPDNIVSNRRLRIIYDTNLRMARAAGQWKRIQAAKVAVPYLMYRAINDRHTRAQHRIWGGLDDDTVQIILPVDHPAWNWLFPPNGWGCRCKVIALGKRDMEARGLRLTTEEELTKLGLPTMANADGNLDGVDTTTFVRGDGVIEHVPTGIDPGFAYNVGKAHMRGLSPTPLDRDIIETQIIGSNPEDYPAMPHAMKVAATEVLDATIDGIGAATEFLAEFGATFETAALFTDVVGQPNIIDAGMVSGSRGLIKAGKLDRGPYAKLAARALRDPDEIWSVWDVPPEGTRKGGNKAVKPRIVRRYLATFDIEGETRTLIVVVEIGSDGWTGRTWFPPKLNGNEEALRSYLDRKVRGGLLQYRRAPKSKGDAQ